MEKKLLVCEKNEPKIVVQSGRNGLSNKCNIIILKFYHF